MLVTSRFSRMTHRVKGWPSFTIRPPAMIINGHQIDRSTTPPNRRSPYEGCQLELRFTSKNFLSEAFVTRSATEWSGGGREAMGFNSPVIAGDLIRVGLTYASTQPFLSPPWWRCFSRSSLREYVRPVSPLECMPGQGATHQLLSGQLAQRPTPMVSYLCDCGDRGFRPF